MSPRASSDLTQNDKPATPVETPADAVDEYDDSEKNYQPRSLKFWTIMIGMYLSIFLVALDRTIIAVAIPAISNEFKSIEDIGWYGSAYMLTAACFNPIFGRVFKIYSTKWAYLTMITIFEIGSAICGAAPNSIAFIFGRAIAGLGSAGVFSGGMMIIIPLIPLRKRPMYTATFGMVFGLASVLGPIIGGSFTDHVSWRWCFYLNLPIGAVTILSAALFLHVPSPQQKQKLTFLQQMRSLDPMGAFFFIPSIVCLILALQWGGTTYSWSAPKIIGLLVTFAVLFVAFIVVEVMTPETAMAPTRIVLNRSVASSMLYMFLTAGSMMSIIYYLAIWFQAVKGDSATTAGVSTIPMVLGMVIFSVFSAKFTQRIGYYVPGMLLGPVLCAAGAGLMSTFTRFSDHSYWIGYQALYGFGLGCGFQQCNLAAQTVLKRADISMGMALMFFMQQLGGAVFLSVGQNVFSTDLVKRLAGVAGLNADVIIHTGATDIRKVVPAGEVNSVIDAYNGSITKVFLMTAILSAVTILPAVTVEWKSIKGKPKADAEKTKEVESESKA